ncbi:amidohydrolase family protein [Amycolatopsis rhabdoformis]|uniref:Amidohydrolase family protein n=1 Tax=Amycolatopsis rhabdoformis TaxID=1448059 RepID=A0ABZ1I2P2_9PSEU|nr:amidohydrolase family protein [Amycolatopsis rhabdoformis]WSE28083.1 amidohydrolase family protein [Amycolatopsis rhabdoformis]
MGAAHAYGRPVVDIHTHALPLPLLQDLAADGLADLSRVADGALHLHPSVSGLAQGARIPLPPEQYDLTRRLEAMDQAGTDVEAVSAPPFVFASMATDPEFVLDVTRRANNALAEFVAGAPDRLIALGTVPIGVEGAVEEAERCVAALGMAGVTIGTYGGGRELDDPVNEPVWTFLSERQVFCFVHPSRTSSPERLREYHLAQLLGYPAETALAAARLIFGGVLDRHRPVLCLAHGGGCLAGLVPRLTIGWQRKPEAATAASSPGDYLRRLHYDTTVFSGDTLERLVAEVGAERVLLGTDKPFDLADVDGAAMLTKLPFTDAEKDAIFGGNAARLITAVAERTRASVGGDTRGTR